MARKPASKRRRHRRRQGRTGVGRPALGRALRTVAELLVLALLALVPFVFVPSAQDAFRLPKTSLAGLLGLASLVVLALAAAVAPAKTTDTAETPSPGTTPDRRRVWWRHPGSLALVALLPFLISAALGLLTGDHPLHTRQALADLGIGAACLIGWSAALPAARLDRLLGWSVLPATGMALLGAAQLHGLYQPIAFVGIDQGDRLGVTGLAGNAGDLGAFLVLPILIAQHRVVRATTSRGRLLWGTAAAVCLYGLAATQTLAALGAVVLASAVFWWLVLPVGRRAKWLGAGLAALAVVVLVVAPLRERVVQKAGTLQELGRAEGWNRLLSGRLDGWSTAVRMMEEEPIVGVGFGGYRAEFNRVKLDLVEEGFPMYQFHREPFFANAHSELLEVGAEQGVLGLLALAWLLWVLGRRVALPLMRRGRAGKAAEPDGSGEAEGGERRRRAESAVALALLTAYAVLALGDFPFRVAIVAYPALVAFAWMIRRAAQSAPPPVTAAMAGEEGR